MIAGYEKSVEDDQRQEEEEQFIFLNIHAWKIMSHRKEVSHVHLRTFALTVCEQRCCAVNATVMCDASLHVLESTR